MTDKDLKTDFIFDMGRLADGSSPAKLPGVSIDNAAYNIIFNNIIAKNYGSGLKCVRSGYRNTFLCNQVTDNDFGRNEMHHFFGIELSTDQYNEKNVKGLDFTPCYENIIARNVISGPHSAGIFIGPDGYVNDFFDNIIIGCTSWSMESLSQKFNSSLNNFSLVHSRGIGLTRSSQVIPVAECV